MDWVAYPRGQYVCWSPSTKVLHVAAESKPVKQEAYRYITLKFVYFIDSYDVFWQGGRRRQEGEVVGSHENHSWEDLRRRDCWQQQ